MKKFNQFLCIAVLTLFSTVMYAQTTITGKVIDGDFNSPLPGANHSDFTLIFMLPKSTWLIRGRVSIT